MSEFRNMTVISKGAVEEYNGNKSVTVEMKENQGQYPSNIAVTFRGKSFELGNALSTGDVIEEVKFGISSREYNGKYYTNLNGFFVKKSGSSGAKPSSTPTGSQLIVNEDDDSLPF